MKNSIDIFPIYLDEDAAVRLVERFLSTQFMQARRNIFGEVHLSFYATVNENNTVDVSVSYSADSGAVQSCGSLLSETIRPYSDDEFNTIKQRQMWALATRRYELRQAEAARAAITLIHEEMFPGTPAAVHMTKKV